MNILFLRGFNNYFNRIVKKYSTLQDYRTRSNTYLDIGNINFNPNDGVVTELIIGGPTQIENNKPLDWENIGSPDYAVCYETGDNNSTTIISRWYVLESVRMRNGQYKIALKRDVIAEHLENLMIAPCFVEKGIITDKLNPLLYNAESMTYNQIKTDEVLLKDTTQSAWLVGYVSKNSPESIRNVSTRILLEGEPTEYYDYSDNEVPFVFGSGQLSTEYSYINKIGFFSGTAIGGYLYGSASAAANVVHNLEVASDGRISMASSNTAYNSSTTQYMSASNTQPTANIINSANANNGVPGEPNPFNVYGYLQKISRIDDSSVRATPIKLSSSINGSEYVSLFNNTGRVWMYIIPYYYTQQYNFISGAHPSDLATSRLVGQAISNYPAAYYNAVKNNETAKTIEPMQFDKKILKMNNKFYIMNVTYNRTHFAIYNGANVLSNVTKSGSCTYSTSTNSNIITALQNLMENQYAQISNTTGIARWTADSTSDMRKGIGWSEQFKYSVELEELTTETISTTIVQASNRNHTYDAPFDLFAIPYGEIAIKSGSTNFTSERNRSLAIARAIAGEFSTSSCYDLQLVPYCPIETVRNMFESDGGKLDLDQLNSSTYNIVSSTTGSASEYCSVVLWSSRSRGSFNIPVNIQVSNFSSSEALNYKISNETQVFRLSSPNFNGMFEFSSAKNNGIEFVNVDYTYKPYSPYIHINPDFKFIYGVDWDDARGLICGGDFSLSFMSSEWKNYQNNNKNYQQIFDRQIQNMDVNNSIAMEKQELTATLGTIQGGLSGVIGGAMAGSAGGPWGAVAGALVGGVAGAVTSGIAGQKDTEFLERSQSENRQYAIDQFGYQLGNIQAMPYSLARTESLTNNNKIWPMLEIYNAKEQEVDALKLKIQYNSMTIMKIGTLSEYSVSTDFDKVFLKGQLIKLDSLDDDFHIADAIYVEVNKGFYIPQGGNS